MIQVKSRFMRVTQFSFRQRLESTLKGFETLETLLSFEWNFPKILIGKFKELLVLLISSTAYEFLLFPFHVV